MIDRGAGTFSTQKLWLVGGATGLAALAMGYLLVVVGPEAAAFVPGALGGVSVLIRPILGLWGVGLVMPFEDLLTFAGGATATKALAALVSVAWVLWKLVTRDSWSRLLRSPLIVVALVFLAYALGSTLWSADAGRLPTGVIRLTMILGLGLLAADLVREWEHAERLAEILVVGGLIAASVTVQQYFFGGLRRAGEGVGGGVNATALILLTLLPFGFLLVRRGRSAIWRVIGLAYVLLAILSVTLTFSRMTLMVLPLVLALEYWELLRTSRNRPVIVAATLGVALLLFQVLPAEEIEDRLATVGPYVSSVVDFGESDGATQVAGRGYHIMIAFAIFADHPIFGAGYGSYGRLFLEYQHEVPGGGQLYGSERSPHGNYWGFLADLGLVGIALWVGVLLAAVRNLRRAWKILSPERTGLPFMFTRAVAVMLLVQGLYGAYAQMHLEKIHWVVLGLTVAVRLMAEATESEPERADVSQTEAGPRERPPSRPSAAVGGARP
jgi:O-antigen ligase